MIPLCKPYIVGDEIGEIRKVLESGWLTQGPKVKEFEEMFKNYLGVKECFAVNSCASALQVAIESQKIKGEIIVPAFTFVASANAIVRAGAIPKFCDVEYDSRNINTRHLESLINSQTEAVMPVHYAGMPCNMSEVMRIADKHKLCVIEDCAETIGGMWNDKMAGSYGIGAFSFFPTKNITTGEGGMVTFNDCKTNSEFFKALRGHGISKFCLSDEQKELSWYREAVMPGMNFRMSDINAAIGVVQLIHIDRINNMRKTLANFYDMLFYNVDGVRIPKVNKEASHVYQMYTITVDESKRNSLVKYLNEQEIQASVHFEPIVPEQKYYRENFLYKKGMFPNSESLAKTIISLPIFPGLKPNEVEFVGMKVREFFK